jgi:hypothetical protein
MGDGDSGDPSSLDYIQEQEYSSPGRMCCEQKYSGPGRMCCKQKYQALVEYAAFGRQAATLHASVMCQELRDNLTRITNSEQCGLPLFMPCE